MRRDNARYKANDFESYCHDSLPTFNTIQIGNSLKS